MVRFAIPAALILVLACTANAAPQRGANRGDDAKIAKRLASLTPGKPQNCLPRDRFAETQGYARTILFVGGRNKVWRSDLVGTCPGLSRGDLPVITSTSGRMCRGDRVQTRARIGGMLTGACALGPFVPYSK
ncbi:hypothetical protein J2W22_003628 [Sphingomonas kyeonggiensis]|uniref:hypothetical protein n=1 Tax=Sphingomonas kyeonggiensis TaxID=1268553 RepID=UPI0027850014|nr:hypothetical protein [Sphingomonas kyeonggiensis]MDQ0251540.1 hypothetical protein [Sphingomonas kyeonggiensis]